MELIWFPCTQDLLGSTSVHCFCFTFNRQWLLCWNQCWFILLLYFEQTGAFMLVTSLVSPSKGSATETTSLKLETFASFWSRLKKTAGIVARKLKITFVSFNQTFYILQRNKQMLTALPIKNVRTRENKPAKNLAELMSFGDLVWLFEQLSLASSFTYLGLFGSIDYSKRCISQLQL